MRPTLYTARWVLPVAQPPLANAAMLVAADGVIERIAPAAAFELGENVARVDLGDALLLPGLINVHAHPELAAFRGLLDDMPFHEWLPALMRCKRGAQLAPADYETAAKWTCVEALRAGITTIGATEDSGAAVAALNEAGMRGLVYLEVFGPAPEQADESLRSLRAKLELHAASSSDRVRLGISPHAPYTVSDTLFELAAGYARTHDLPVATHAAEAEAESALVREGTGPFAAGLRTRGIATPPRGASTIAVLARTGIMDCAPLLIHAVQVSAADRSIIAASGAGIAHCPIANARLGHGVAPIVEAVEQGIAVAIGTDSVASNNRIDLLEEARIAQVLQRSRLRSAAALPADRLLRMITIEGARLLGLGDRVGTLEAGKAADFCVVATDRPHTVPVTDSLATLFHAARGSDVIMTAVQGRVLFSEDRVHTLNEPELQAAVAAIADRLCHAKAAA